MRPRFLLRALLASSLILLAACGGSRPATTPEPSSETKEPVFSVDPTTFTSLPGWSSTASVAPALQAFARSCRALRTRPPDAVMVQDRPAFGTVRDWIPACMRVRDLRAAGDTSAADARQFFTRFFSPYRIGIGTDREGLFTGYFEPELRGARDSSARYPEPLRTPPDDLVRVPVQRFLPDIQETLFGRVERGTLVPYPTRAAIQNGALSDQDLALVWVDSRIDKFFLQIQGSGRVRLADGGTMRVGYAAQNGQPYRAIGQDLIQMGAIPRAEISLQTIRAWLRANPARADSVMNLNRSYVFFRKLDVDASLGPLGAQGVPLTPGHSLAVDPRYVPYGAPLWLVARRPDASSRNAEALMDSTKALSDTSTVPMRRLLIAQDTGGAIRGPVRGDVFWGSGPDARAVAGRMKARGTYFVLLPKTLLYR